MIKAFRVIALLEGISYILLLFAGVPMKYFWDDPTLVKALGMPHGLLFVAYIILAFLIKEDKKWDIKTFFIVLIASVLPFGTFYVDRKYLK